MIGYGLVLVPGSWHIGKWDKGHKVLYAFGPLRFVKYRRIAEQFGEINRK